jgi:N-methylhydantoinase A
MGSAGLNRARLAVDIGGTFTDVVLETAAGDRVTTKLLTTYDHPGRAVLEGIDAVLRKAGRQPAEIGLIIHGTTLATNALIQRRGARTALLTTAGHRDALEMAHEDRFEQYDIMIDRPRPLVPRHLRLPVRERLDRDGQVLLPLDESSVAAALSVLDENAVESVAIGFLHAFVNPAHERRVAELLQAARPQLSITLASEVCPEIREFERLSTACANAYVRPLMARYLRRLQDELHAAGFDCPFLLMTSGGGLTTVETAARFPIRLVESGPAGGAILAREVARAGELRRVISYDMGGTTAKLCLLDDFEPLTSRSFEVDRVYRFKKGSGLPVRIPVIEMVEIGAGGGSIARVDPLGRIQVGPDSAGSEPGPACYGRGGTEAAVTDADVCLGRVYPDTFAGGTFTLDQDAAGQALQAGIGQPLGLGHDDAALGVSEVVDENMAAAARAHAAEFGLDLGSRDMVAFGGAAPLHAARLGDKLGVKRIVIPAGAGVGSAVGFLLAPVAFEVVRSRRQDLSELDTDMLNDLLAEMHEEALAVVRQGVGPAVPDRELAETRHAYMRYRGQGHEIAVPLPPGEYREADRARLREAFEAAYCKLYGRTIEGVAIEALSWTLTIAEVRREPPAAASAAPEGKQAGPRPIARQALLDPASGQSAEAAVYLRAGLPPGAQLSGPALITEDQTTTVVPPGWQAAIGKWGEIVLSRSGTTLPGDPA